MSTARFVPETWHLDDDGPWPAARQLGRRHLAAQAFVRLRAADGTSHARSMAFFVVLIAIQGLVALVGVISTVSDAGIAGAARSIVEAVAPGPVGGALNTAIDQARAAGESERYAAISLGLLGSLVTGTSAMGQFQRSLNRLYGVEHDRPTLAKYRRAFGLALTAGSVMALAFGAVAFGNIVGGSLEQGPLVTLWNVVRLPLGLVLLAAAMAILMSWCPQRRRPGWSWLAVGAGVAVTLWAAVTAALNIAFGLTDSFGDVYGPLAGVVALVIWSYVSSLGLLYGAAVAAELESFRSDRRSAQWTAAGDAAAEARLSRS
ncbi:MAG: YihY/virulence factor BrkB family protein [Ilumatobacteraceae bacterium]